LTESIAALSRTTWRPIEPPIAGSNPARKRVMVETLSGKHQIQTRFGRATRKELTGSSPLGTLPKHRSTVDSQESRSSELRTLLKPTSKRVVVITGTPCVGKTEVSEILRRQYGLNVIHAGEVVAEERLYSDYDASRDTYIVDLRRAARRISRLVQDSSSDVVVEGHYAETLVSRKYHPMVVVLRCDPEILEDRMRRKGYSTPKIKENVLSEILDSCLIESLRRQGKKRIAEIDTTDKSPSEVAKLIIDVMEGESSVGFGGVNWLERLEKSGKLERFLD
jgi:adenylate kinase